MTRTLPFFLLVAGSTILAGCGGTSPQARAPRTVAPQTGEPGSAAKSAEADEESPPAGRLPRDVKPQKYTLALSVDPSQKRFGGRTLISVHLDRPRDVIWLHGRDLEVESAKVAPDGEEAVPAEWEQVDEHGVAALRLPQAVGPGDATIDITYSAPFDEHLRGLYRVEEKGDAYAFTQFEATAARQAFPSFDEPSFKTPFDVTLVVKKHYEAAANTPAVETEELDGALKRVRFATTRPMPTYLVALAVGPFDVVEADPLPATEHRDRELPLRGLAVKGKGGKLDYALEHVQPLLESLEAYFGDAYPYRKLDIVAVPDFAAGAMENVGLVTFREYFLLHDGEPSERVKRSYAGIMAHELAHMWFGNLVTMPWWNDIWLNEAFATWMGHRAVADVFPDYHAELSLLDSIHGAMSQDSLTSARKIRQPIESNHDIRNAFDAITYRKGGGVLSMFEKWLGKETFQKALRRYMSKHAWGNATADDLLAALTKVADRDVAGPFKTFLEQPGVPFVHVKPSCEQGQKPSLALVQERYFPVGSSGDASQTWEIPFCVRYGTGDGTETQCTLVTEAKSTMTLATESCPDWVMPNADGAGYYRFSLPAEQLETLQNGGFEALSAREKLALADSLEASFKNASLSADAVYGSLERFAEADVRPVAQMPMSLVAFARERLVEADAQDAVTRFGGKLYRPAWRRLGWKAGRKDDGEDKLLRASLAKFLTLAMEDKKARRKAAQLGRRFLGYRRGKIDINADAVDDNVVPVVLAVAVQEGDEDLWNAMVEAMFEVEDPSLRDRMLGAISHANGEELAQKVRAFVLDERLRVNEVWEPLQVQMSMPETREATWAWVQENFDTLTERMSKGHSGYLPWLAAGFCSEDKANEVESFFEERVSDLPGGPRNLAGALEAVRLCAARVNAHQEAAREFFR